MVKVAVLQVKLYAPWVHSLKEKRMVAKSLLAKLRNKFQVSAAEVEEQDVHQTLVTAGDDPLDLKMLPDRPEMVWFVETIQKPVNIQEGDKLPVSTFMEIADGSVPSGSAAHERRNVATEVPVWKPENCIQCNRCSFVCPHAVIRPAVMDQKEAEAAPEGMEMLPVTGFSQYQVSMIISEEDCTGCGSCAAVCPGKNGEKALEMCPVHEKEEIETALAESK